MAHRIFNAASAMALLALLGFFCASPMPASSSVPRARIRPEPDAYPGIRGY